MAKFLFNDKVPWSHLLSALSLGCRIASGLVVLPLALRLLSIEDLALYYLFLAVMAITPVIDYTFSPTISRAAAYFLGGGLILRPQGLNISEVCGYPNIIGLKSLFLMQRIILQLGGLLVGVLVFTILWWMELRGSSESSYNIIAAIICSISAGINIVALGKGAFLSGCGHVSYTSFASIVGSLTNIIITSILLLLNCGLLGLAVGSLIGSLITNFVLYIKSSQVQLEWNKIKIDSHLCESKPLVFRALWPNVWRSALSGAGSYMIFQSQVIISSNLLPKNEVAALGVSLQLVTLLSSLSNTFVTVHIPLYVNIKTKSQPIELKRVFSRDLMLGLLSYSIGSIICLFLAPLVIKAIGSTATLVPFGLLVLLFGYRLLEFHHVQFAQLVCADNLMPFVMPSLISGVCIVGLSCLLGAKYGLLGILLSTALVQAACNNWYPVKLGLEANNWTYADIIKSGMKEMFGLARKYIRSF